MRLQQMVKVGRAFSMYVLLLATEALLATAVSSKYPVQIFHLTISDRIPGLAILLVRDAIVWFFAYLGYTRLVTYAAELGPTAESKAIDRIAAATGLLALGVALPGMFWRGIELFAPPGTEAGIVHRLPSTYIGLVLTLVGFLLLRNGLLIFLRHAGVRSGSYPARWRLAAAFAAGGAAFAIFMIYSFLQYNPPIPLLTVLLTIVVPYCLMWLLGGLCLNSLQFYVRAVPGLIYRPMFRWLSTGVAILILMQVAVQCVEGSLAFARHTPSGLAVAVVLVLSALQAVSFILIAQGAKQLGKIEEV